MTDQPTDVSDLERLHGLLSALQEAFDAWDDERSNRQDHQDAACALLTRRAIEFGLSAVDDFHFNRPAAAAATGRCLMETAIALRWALLASSNATRWWHEGDAAIQKSVRSLGLSDDPKVVAVRDAPSLGIGLPSIQKMAVAAGMSRPYARWYATLSGYVHPSRVSLGYAYTTARQEPLPLLITPCAYFAGDVVDVFVGWSTLRQLPAPAHHP